VNKWRRRVRQGQPLPVTEQGVAPLASEEIIRNSDDTVISAQRMADSPMGRNEWRAFLAEHGQDPDTVTFTHGVTSNPTGGFWNKLNNVRPIAQRQSDLISDSDIEAAQKRVRGWKLPQRIPGTGLGPEIAATVNLADMQLHKPDGDGLEGTLDRLYHGLENTHAWVQRKRAAGMNITQLVLVNNGDPFEGISGNYANQNHTVKAGLRGQMNTVLDVWEAYSRELFPQFDKGQFVTVHCNHTQFGRQGGAKDSITGDEDTGSAFLAEALQRILRGRPEFDHVRFTIPDDQMNVYTTIAGIPVGFNHKIPGKDASGFETWLNGQVRGDRQAYEARIWITAHKHHWASWDMGSCTVIQCPSCDGGSKWLRDSTGRFSRSGILALLIGEHEPMGWTDQVFL
jgi:hypothetical protein